MAVQYTKYSIQCKLYYTDQITPILDHIRAIPTVLLVHIIQDLGPESELVTIKILTPHSPSKTYDAIRRKALADIPNLRNLQYLQSTFTKLS
jgi:hypothetical protein